VFRSAGAYLELCALPTRLSLEYLTIPWVWGLRAFGAGVLLAAVATIVVGARPSNGTSRLVLWSAVWLLCAVGPYLNFRPLVEMFAERRAYVALVGWCGLVGATLGGTRKEVRPILTALFVAAVLLSQASLARGQTWAHTRTLWRETVQSCPGSYRAHTQLMREYMAANQGALALAECKASVRVGVRLRHSYGRAVEAYYMRGLVENALASFEKASTMVSAEAKSRLCFQSSKGKMSPAPYEETKRLTHAAQSVRDGRLAEAASGYLDVLRANPMCTNAWLGLGNTLVRMHLYRHAVDAYDAFCVLWAQRRPPSEPVRRSYERLAKALHALGI